MAPKVGFPLLLLVLTLCVCFNDIEPRIPGGDDNFLPYQGEVAELAQTEVEIREGVDLEGVTYQAYWFDTTCPGDDKNRTAVIHRGECYMGLTFDCDEIYVARRDRVSSTAFVHELGHCYLLFLDRDGDATHSNFAWWEMMSNINLMARDNGW